jgi:hypothetical protein
MTDNQRALLNEYEQYLNYNFLGVEGSRTDGYIQHFTKDVREKARALLEAGGYWGTALRMYNPKMFLRGYKAYNDRTRSDQKKNCTS